MFCIKMRRYQSIFLLLPCLSKKSCPSLVSRSDYQYIDIHLERALTTSAEAVVSKLSCDYALQDLQIPLYLDVKVPARTWIWKGINFGFLGCMKISSCGGQIVTYGAHIDMELALQVSSGRWCRQKSCLSITVRLKITKSE